LDCKRGDFEPLKSNSMRKADGHLFSCRLSGLLQEQFLASKIIELEIMNLKKGEESKESDVNVYAIEAQRENEKLIKEREEEVKALMELIIRKDRHIEQLEVETESRDEQGDFILEEKAKTILNRAGVREGLKRVAAGVYRVGKHLLELKFKKT